VAPQGVGAKGTGLSYAAPMHPNEELLTDFYRGFAKQDAAPMVKAYAADAEFSDPAFPMLRGAEIGQMWTMLCGRAKGFSLTFRDLKADDFQGSVHWEAKYLFGGRRPVHNVIDATFTFRGGKIAKHVDHFDFWRWSRMALGPAGTLLGWSKSFQRQVQAQAAKGLREFQPKV
jgi:ketosteroid isomerase-like protein